MGLLLQLFQSVLLLIYRFIQQLLLLIYNTYVDRISNYDDDDNDNNNNNNISIMTYLRHVTTTTFDGSHNQNTVRFLQQQQEQQVHYDDTDSTASDILSSSYTTANNNTLNWSYIVWNIIGSIICIMMFAILSGLFLGFLTLDTIDLQIIQRSSLDEDERMYATIILPVAKRRHQILVTLELISAVVYETLPIFLDALVPSWVAILLSVTIVLIFGEIIPSGIFMGPNQLYLGYLMVPLMSFLLWLLNPLATPLVKLLDYLTDTDEHDTDPYSRDELSALVRIQHEAELVDRQHYPMVSRVQQTRLSRSMKKDRRKDQTWRALKEELLERVQEKQESNPKLFPPDLGDDEDEITDRLTLQLHNREVSMVEGALQMKTVHAMDVYTPLSSCYCVAENVVLDKMGITTIYGHGFSRVPIYHINPDDTDDTSQILGFLITRQLMVIDWDDLRVISTLPLQRPTCVSPRMNLIDLFEVMQKEGKMLTFVCARPDLANKAFKAELPIPVEAGLMGIITLVDIMESIIQDRIYDEGDIRDRDRAVATLHRWAAALVVKFMRRTAALKKLERRRSGGSSNINSTINNTNSYLDNTEEHRLLNHDEPDTPLESNNHNRQRVVQFDNNVQYPVSMHVPFSNNNNKNNNTVMVTSNDNDEEAIPLLGTSSSTAPTSSSSQLPGPPMVPIKKAKLRSRLFMSNQ